MVGFARNAVLEVAGAIVDAVKKKEIRHFFLVGGCDGANRDGATTPNSLRKLRRTLLFLRWRVESSGSS